MTIASLWQKLINGVDVTKVYLPKRVIEIAKKYGLTGDMAMNLITGWDFTRSTDRKRAFEYVKKHKPWIIIGSPLYCV